MIRGFTGGDSRAWTRMALYLYPTRKRCPSRRLGFAAASLGTDSSNLGPSASPSPAAPRRAASPCRRPGRTRASEPGPGAWRGAAWRSRRTAAAATAPGSTATGAGPVWGNLPGPTGWAGTATATARGRPGRSGRAAQPRRPGPAAETPAGIAPESVRMQLGARDATRRSRACPSLLGQDTGGILDTDPSGVRAGPLACKLRHAPESNRRLRCFSTGTT